MSCWVFIKFWWTELKRSLNMVHTSCCCFWFNTILNISRKPKLSFPARVCSCVNDFWWLNFSKDWTFKSQNLMPKEVIGSTLCKDTLIYPSSENPISVLSVYRPLYSVPPFTNTSWNAHVLAIKFPSLWCSATNEHVSKLIKGTHNNSNKIIFARFPRQYWTVISPE